MDDAPDASLSLELVGPGEEGSPKPIQTEVPQCAFWDQTYSLYSTLCNVCVRPNKRRMSAGLKRSEIVMAVLLPIFRFGIANILVAGGLWRVLSCKHRGK